MSELDKLFQDADAIVDTYGSTDWSIDQLLELRRNLAGISWRIASMSKDVFSGAGMGYLGRKYAIAKHIVDARAIDAKKAINALEKEADAVPSVVAAQKQEIEAEANKERRAQNAAIIAAAREGRAMVEEGAQAEQVRKADTAASRAKNLDLQRKLAAAAKATLSND